MDTHFEAVDELGHRKLTLVPERGDGMEVAIGTVFEFDTKAQNSGAGPWTGLNADAEA